MTLLTPRDRRRLRQAHESGCLDATCRDNRSLVRTYGLWCWRLRLPMVWFERRSPRSRFAIVRLDMMTTPHMLTGAGQSVLRELGEARISAHDAVWERIPRAAAAKLAHEALRAALRLGNYRWNRAPLAKIDARGETRLKVVTRRRVPA